MGKSDFHHRFSLPQKVSYRLAYSVPQANRDSNGSPRFLTLPFSWHAVLLDPAAVSGSHRL